MKIEEFIADYNTSYHSEHMVTREDFERAINLKSRIESSRRKHPVDGDIVICKKSKFNVRYNSGHLESGSFDKNDFSICTESYVPFINPKTLVCSASGGYWVGVKKSQLKKFNLVGKREKLFCFWGHCGACGNGALHVPAIVNVWEYTNPKFY